jgi:four helix bundle protein
MSSQMAHERLRVYDKALSFVRVLAPEVELWPSRYSVRDQINRAMESTITNLVKAAWLQPSRQAVYLLECSLGSVLECAACIDIALIRNLLDNESASGRKLALLEVVRMEVGLRKSWSPSVREEPEHYGEPTCGFSHESLLVYQRGLQLFRVLVESVLSAHHASDRYARRIDEAATSLLLNISEGNGRFSQLDQGLFIDHAREAGIKLTAYIDLASPIETEATNAAKALLHEVMAMLGGLKGYLGDRGKDPSPEL